MKILPSILLVAAAANVGTALAPRGKTRKTVVFAVTLATLLALLLPVITALDDRPALPNDLFSDATFDAAGNPSDCVSSAAERALASEVARRFGVAPRAVCVTLPAGESECGSIRITLARKDANREAAIAAWLKSESASTVQIAIEGEINE